MLQHNNNPKHSLQIVKNYLRERIEEEFLEVMTWPSQKPEFKHRGINFYRKKNER